MRSVCAVIVAGGALPAFAQFYTVDLSPWRNSPASAYINPSTLPVGAQTYTDVPFVLPGVNSDTSFYSWNANAIPLQNNPLVLELPIGIYGVNSVYTIMNTYWGQALGGLVTVQFFGSDGAFQAFDLIGNIHIRDYNNARWTNTINGTTTVNVFDNGLGQRLDRQQFALSRDFMDETLERIKIVDFGGVNFSRAFIVAATVEIPAPGALALAAVGGVVAIRRRR